MSTTGIKPLQFVGIILQAPETWMIKTDSYTEHDGRECSMIEISAVEGDPRSIIISYGPMPEGSDAIMEAGDTYEEVVGEIGPDVEDDPICEYDFLGTTGYGFEVPTEDGLACNFICVATGSQTQIETGIDCHLFTILTTGRTFEEIDELLDLVEQNISFE
jgi:hypothetical protein